MEGYERLKTVGKGSFGTANLCRRLQDNKLVVLKEIITQNMDDSEIADAKNEAEILASLDHKNIIQYMGSYQKNDSLIIIMEYADGGTLAQLIKQKKDKNMVFSEAGILNIVRQISSALSYMHSCKILHRDLKAANIFLNLNGAIKVGDFGISKVLNTKSQAQTVVGTPYYLSPEMCEGSEYNEKSDVWALGCILYELATLKKPFDAPTLPVLVQRITSCHYDEIPSIYSQNLWDFVRVILQKSPAFRPSAKQIHDVLIPQLTHNLEKIDLDSTINSTITNNRARMKKGRSVLYEIYDFGDWDQKIVPMDLPHKRIVDFGSCATHSVVIMEDFEVYGWGENNFGQLALNYADNYAKKSPTKVPIPSEFEIVRCAVGNGFTLFLTDYGQIFSCGNGTSGCLGQGDSHALITPTRIDSLKTTKITKICSSSQHVVALSAEGRVYTWGSSKMGALAQGHVQKRTRPFPIIISTKIEEIYCTDEATLIKSIHGQFFAAGSNKNGRLNLQNAADSVSTFQLIDVNFGKIVNVSMGESCTIFVNECGAILIYGFVNDENRKIDINNAFLSTCGPTFCAVADTKNTLWFWGKFRRGLHGMSSLQNSVIYGKNTKFQSVVTLADDEEGNFDNYVTTTVKSPKSILALYASKNHVNSGNTIEIDRIMAKSNSILVLVGTTVPAPLKKFDLEINATSSSFQESTVFANNN